MRGTGCGGRGTGSRGQGAGSGGGAGAVTEYILLINMEGNMVLCISYFYKILFHECDTNMERRCQEVF